MTMSPCRVLLISGSLRAGSTNSAALLTATHLDIDGITAELFEGMGSLPAYNPDDDVEPLDPQVARLRETLDKADAVLFCTPEYAGALPGAFKNLLDWTVGGGTYDKPVAWINVSAGTGAVDAHDSLRKVLERTGTDLVPAACARIPVTRLDVGDDGTIANPVIRAEVGDSLRTLCAHVRGGAQSTALDAERE